MLELLVAGEFEKATEGFDANVKQAMPATKLKQIWQTVTGQVGALQKQNAVRRTQAGPHTVIDVDCTFEKSPLVFRLAFDADQKIAGLYFLPPQKQPAADQKAPADGLEQTTRSMLELLVAGEFEKATEGFDANVKQEMPAERLKQSWEALTGQLGALQKQTALRRSRQRMAKKNGEVGLHTVIDVDIIFEKGSMVFRLTFDADQKISGLGFLPPADDGLEQATRSNLRLLVAGEFEKVTEGFAAHLKQEVPAEKLKQTWQAITGQVGALQRQNAVRRGRSDDFTAIDVDVTFEKASMVFRLLFDADQKIAGLAFLPPQKQPAAEGAPVKPAEKPATKPQAPSEEDPFK